MKILAIGDFHGRFPKKYENLIKKEKIDLVVSNGDYPPFSLVEEFFKYVYKNPFDVNLWDFIGKKRYKETVIRDHKKGEEVLKKLNKLPVPVFTVFGNHDHPHSDVMDILKPKDVWEWDWERQTFFARVLKKYKNIKRIDYRYAEFKGYIFIGARGSSFPGRVKSKAFKRHRKKLDKLFRKFSKENKQRKVIFVSHNVPYETKLDKVTAKDSHELARGRHYGSKLVRRIIDKYKPVFYMGGHIEEGYGKQKIGRTLMINTGSIHHGQGAIIDINKGKVKVKFIN